MWFGHGLGPFGHTKPGGLGPALTMVPTIDNFCHAPETIDEAKLLTAPHVPTIYTYVLSILKRRYY